ncbi:MAG: hypothetical protein GY773_09810 [Actinomycetia bacterium]|nr:hypothetical protein [Actinomycetes bacterium]
MPTTPPSPPSRRLSTLDRQLGGDGSGATVRVVLGMYRRWKMSTRAIEMALASDHGIEASREKVRLALRDLDEWEGER